MTEAQKQAVLDRDYNAMLDARRQHLLPGEDLRHRRAELCPGGEHDDRHVGAGLPADDAAWWALAGRLALREGRYLTWPASRPADHQPHPGHRRRDRSRQDRGALLEAAVRRVRVDEGLGRRERPRRGDPGLQRPRLRIHAGAGPHVRARLRRRVPAGRRRVRPAPGTRRPGPCRSGRPTWPSRSSSTSSTSPSCTSSTSTTASPSRCRWSTASPRRGRCRSSRSP